MDQPLQTLLHLYGEADGPALAGDAEAQALLEARFWMDHRPRVRPDAATLEAVFAAAEQAAAMAPGTRRPDRAPVARRRTRRASVLVGLALSVAAAVAVMPLAESPSGPDAPALVATQQMPAAVVATAAAEPAEAEVLAPEAMPEPAPARPSAALAWEGDRAHLDAVARKTAELRARLDSTLWDAPAADLSLQGGAGVFTQASSGGQ